MPDRNVMEADPRELHQKPPFEEPGQRPPGLESEMRNRPDHGEQTYQGSGRLRGKSALITGGDSGIGKAVAIAYAREGADVVISYTPQEEKDGQDRVRWIESAGRKALAVPGDVGDESYCRDPVERTFREFGRLDVLVNNAAYQMTHEKLEEFGSDEWDHTFRTNLYSMFYFAKAAIPRMKPGGAVINTASVQAYNPRGTLLAYATTKGAIVTFTKALSDLAIENGIRVNAVAPGPVWTPLIPTTLSPDHVKKFGKDTAMERPAQPAELAPAYVFLACGDSSYITGSILDLTGGKMLP